MKDFFPGFYRAVKAGDRWRTSQKKPRGRLPTKQPELFTTRRDMPSLFVQASFSKCIVYFSVLLSVMVTYMQVSVQDAW